MTKISVLLVFGGQSSEHDVSLASAHNVYAALDEDKYDVFPCYITRNGEWHLVDGIDDRALYQVLTPRLGSRQFETADGTVIEPDVMLPILHGIHGEDGDVQGLARLMGLPCAGPSLIGAAITMDKDVAKRLFREAGVPVVDWLTWHTEDPQPMYENIVAKLGEVVFVKPANTGSSVGVSKVKNKTEFSTALREAAKFDSLIMVERAIEGREIEIAVLGNEHPKITRPGEILPGEEFYSYEDKYDIASTAQVKVPAELDAEVAEHLTQYALKAYRATRGHGMARIDFFVTAEGEIFLNEINSIPGFTNISMYPKLWRAEGITYPTLLDRLVALALE
jgi:D-alanine-D-alanine ligase